MIQKFIYDSLIFDSHAHISSEGEDEISQIILNAKNAGLSFICNVSIDIESSLKSLEASSKSNGYIKSFVGISPDVLIPENQDKNFNFNHNLENKLNQLRDIVINNKPNVFGIGEVGVDGYKLKKLKLNTEIIEKCIKKQEELLRSELEIASEFSLPVSLHSRWSESKCIKIVKNYRCFGIFHSFTGTYEQAKEILDAGWGLGVNCIITYENAENLRVIYRKILGKIPKDVTPEWFYKKGVYFETDSPFLLPQALKNMSYVKNEPKNVVYVWKKMISMS